MCEAHRTLGTKVGASITAAPPPILTIETSNRVERALVPRDKDGRLLAMIGGRPVYI